MIRLTDLAGNGSFTMGGKKFEYGKVYSIHMQLHSNL